ncbi:TMAO reductase system periplasmic protein TorT [Pseudohalocynthiibacter aestuariivivens]|uniref:TMAO reductase system periplasmic protein TorT n=1 Tax=Pseudohalocynthiibacter aestuariivivens TaxID=1591409 RepID=A0ABV5JEC9_9RHOB|nr:TMAO reductase system periplasmic protein TorT [Pseudohalocynthiibacter aestuariivivens]MBS9718803.1 TMAO reductase system periplasmic protein TorT [Pseudohalocynthiibacter aestuariivivens]
MEKMKRALRFATAAGLAMSLGGAAYAGDTWEWWPNSVEKISGDAVETFDYTPRMDAPSQKWHVCVLLPHLKDTWWVGIGVGAMREAERQGIKASLFQAGGYTELNKQLSQFDDCVALGVDAILIAAISEGALRPKIEAAREQGIKMIAVGNPMSSDAALDSAVFGDYNIDAEVAGRALVEHYTAMGRESARVINFAGVAGAGWAEQAAQGWTNAFEGTIVELVEHKYGETGKSTQLKLVEDTIQAYDDIDAYVGVAVMAEVAPDVLEEAGMAGKVDILAFYMSEGALNGVIEGSVLGVASNPMVVEAAVAMDTAIRLLEGEEVPGRMRLPPVWIDREFVETQDMSKFTPPDGWEVIYTVE